MFKNNDKMRDVMLATVISGLVATIAYVIIFSLAIHDENFKLMLILVFSPLALWVAGYLAICYCFKWKFGNERRWVATLCSFPVMFEILVAAIAGETYILTFMKWYSMIGITISVLIFEYKFMTHGKKKERSNNGIS